jgi:hypothetical protein
VPDTTKTYTYTPTTAGTQTFSAQIKAVTYKPAGCSSAANCYDSYQTVQVKAVCGARGCAVVCPGAHQSNPPSCTCDLGYTMQGGSCVVTTCSDPRAVAPLCSTCTTGYMMRGGSCVLIPPSVSLTVDKSQVRRGTTATLNWNVSGLSGDPSVSCGISSNPAGVAAFSMPSGTTPTWSGSQATGAIKGTTIFTLSCTGASSVSATVKILPTFNEI